MKVKFSTQEMFVIYVLMSSAKMMSHKIALKKMVNDFLSDPYFGRAIEIRDLTEKNLEKSKDAFKKDIEDFAKEMGAYKGKPKSDVPQELVDRENEIKTGIVADTSKRNKKLIAEFDGLMAKNNDFEIEVGDLAKKAILQIAMEDDVKISDLNLSKDAVESFADVCLKLGID